MAKFLIILKFLFQIQEIQILQHFKTNRNCKMKCIKVIGLFFAPERRYMLKNLFNMQMHVKKKCCIILKQSNYLFLYSLMNINIFLFLHFWLISNESPKSIFLRKDNKKKTCSKRYLKKKLLRSLFVIIIR